MKSFVIILKDHEKSEAFGQVALSSGIRHGWILERFDAIDGRKYQLIDYNLKHPTSPKKVKRFFERPGVVGCFLSHYTLWKKCVELNQPIGIFEQDVIFQQALPLNLNFTDILRLDRFHEGKSYGTGRWWEGTHGYFVTPSGATKLLNWSVNRGIWNADMMLGTDVVDIQFNDDGLIILDNNSKEYSLTGTTF
jgi:GR25 family glycosyltransferase involved in LPS biosynthesis